MGAKDEAICKETMGTGMDDRISEAGTRSGKTQSH